MQESVKSYRNKMVMFSIIGIMIFSLLGCNDDKSASNNILISSSVSDENSSWTENTSINGVLEIGETETSQEADNMVYSEHILEEELESITAGVLSPEHECYEEAVAIDPECAEYISELSIYDKEIDDTFIVHISLPPDYDENEKYPMVVMTDDIWRLSEHPLLRQMMENGEIQDVIVVSVGYPNDYDYETIRERDFLQNPESFLHFLVDNLIPYLKEHYAIANENMTLTGFSFGGFFAYYSLFQNNTIGRNTFSNYVIGSPSLQAGIGALSLDDFEEEYSESNKELQARVYVTAGGMEPPPYISTIEAFHHTIRSREYQGLELTFEVIPDCVHATIAKPTISNAMTLFYGL